MNKTRIQKDIHHDRRLYHVSQSQGTHHPPDLMQQQKRLSRLPGASFPNTRLPTCGSHLW